MLLIIKHFVPPLVPPLQLRHHPLPRHLPHRSHHDRHRHPGQGHRRTHQLRQEEEGVRGACPGRFRRTVGRGGIRGGSNNTGVKCLLFGRM